MRVSLVSAVSTQVSVGTGAERQSMKVQGMWPYWLDGHAPTTVKNSFDMSSMYLLTGMTTASPSHALWFKAYVIRNSKA